MGDLSRSLVAAAAAAICPVAGHQFAVDDWSPEDWKPEARVAVAAVLETLAVSKTAEINTCRIKPAEDCGRCRRLSDQVAELRGLAAEVKEDTA